ncbi:hypothetical protein IB270_35615 [Ensifer sp. ENS05]|uniref:DUF7660 family protein n=1 Tax=Ensifer sp. ENS05 TaxID=2769277 RepID=UPI00177CB42B|nr:hypothetical protein [Ensifer sp. ENS05]MBD9598141.1 hypothetical protein [Ensifer sp. ENS05]
MATVDCESVTNRKQFCEFLDDMRKELIEGQVQWENSTLENFLEAFSAWVGDMDGYYKNRGIERPETLGWIDLARMFHAARFYE